MIGVQTRWRALGLECHCLSFNASTTAGDRMRSGARRGGPRLSAQILSSAEDFLIEPGPLVTIDWADQLAGMPIIANPDGRASGVLAARPCHRC
jgi:hypothetical protein